jgi:hypothetical protein
MVAFVVFIYLLEFGLLTMLALAIGYAFLRRPRRRATPEASHAGAGSTTG